MTGFKTRILDKSHKKDGFECGQPSLSKYLKEQAGQDMKNKMSLCFVSLDSENNVQGFYTLSNSSVLRVSVPEEVQKKFGYKDIPVTLIGRLARDQKYRGQGLGELLLMDALKRCLDASKSQSASFAVVTDPIDPVAEKFYRQYGFQKLKDSQRMFIPMKTVEILFNVRM